MGKKENILKKNVPWIILTPVLALIFAGAFYFNQKSISLPLEYQDEEYELLYGPDFSLQYEIEYGNGSARAINRVNEVAYPNKIDKKDVKQLLSSLDIRKINLRNFDELLGPGESFVMAEEEDRKVFFEIRGENWIETDGDICLMVTEEGKIYVNGYRYTGDSTQFQEAFSELVKQLISEDIEDADVSKRQEQRYKEDFRYGLKKIHWNE